jgi:hypothetical protein
MSYDTSVLLKKANKEMKTLIYSANSVIRR